MSEIFGTQQIQFQADREAAAMKLALATPPDRLADALAEVERRTKLFADIRTGSPRDGEHPELAAFESVTHDATFGRLA